MAISDHELEGRRTRSVQRRRNTILGDDGRPLDLPIFDRARAVGSGDPVARMGLSSNLGGADLPLRFTRRPEDDRPGRRVPFHEPEPDRLAKAEALRQMILAQDERRGVSLSTAEQTRPRHHVATGRTGRTPDIPEPRGVMPSVPRERANIMATRGDRTLYFESAAQAERVMTGDAQANGKAVQNAAGGITRAAFGWEWTRIGDGGRGRRRKGAGA